jgi:hypothetical protein
MTPRREGIETVLTAAVLLLSSACASNGDQAQEPEGTGARSSRATVTFSRTGCAYAGPADIPAGEVTIRAVNGTPVQFDIDLWLLDEGHTYQELATHMEEQVSFEGEEPGLGHPTFATLVAHTTAFPKGSDQLTIPLLRAGTYGFACIRIESGMPADIMATGPFMISD